MRRIVYGASALVLVAAAALVPVPLFVIAPAPAISVAGVGDAPQVIAVEGAADEVTGDLLLTAVEVRREPLIPVVLAALDPAQGVTAGIVPPGVDTDEFVRMQRRLFEESVRVAAAVGLRAAGRDVTVSGGGARIEQIIPGTPADGTLQQGDVIVEADGQRVQLASQLVAVTARKEPGDTVRLVVERGDERLERDVEVQPLPGTSRPGLGVLVSTIQPTIELPVEVRASDQLRIGGESAGLMIALTVYDLVDPGDLTRGRVIAGTGTIDLTGRVGEISGVRQKVVAAASAGATVFLVPSSQAGEARRSAPEGMRVIGVGSMDEALAALTGD